MQRRECATQYPILLVHGIGFRDRKYLNYWGRIPKALEARGATVFYGQQDSWATIEKNAEMLRQNLMEIVALTGCKKVNVIARSKGGLEARYLAATLDCGQYISSITTVSTPHHGSKTMDVLLKTPHWMIWLAAVFINLWFRILGDRYPDFLHTCDQLTTTSMNRFNQENPDVDNVYYQSYATAMRGWWSDVIMCIPHAVIFMFEGENDGIVATDSARWSQFGGVWRSATRRGISHPDAVDLRRSNFSNADTGKGIADIRECYVQVVRELKAMGY